MSEFMFRGNLSDVGRFVPGRTASEKCRVFHASDLGTRLRIDDSDDFVRVRTKTSVELRKSLEHDVKVTTTGSRVRSESKHVHFNRTHGRGVGAVSDGEVGAGGEGEIADVFSNEIQRFSAVRIGVAAGRYATGSDNVAAGHRQMD